MYDTKTQGSDSVSSTYKYLHVQIPRLSRPIVPGVTRISGQLTPPPQEDSCALYNGHLTWLPNLCHMEVRSVTKVKIVKSRFCSF